MNLKTPHLLIMALCCSVSFFYASRQSVIYGVGFDFDTKVQTFTAMNEGYDTYKKLIYQPWRARLLSSGCGNLWMRTIGYDSTTINFKSRQYASIVDVVKDYNSTVGKFACMIAGYNALWFFACLILVIIFSKDKFVFILGMSAASYYCFSPIAKSAILPWDWSSMFFFMLALFTERKNRKLLLPVMAVGMGFKETIIILSVLPMFWDGLTIKKRTIEWIKIVAVCLIAKATLDIIAGNDNLIFTALVHHRIPNSSGEYYLIDQNVRELFTSINNPIFAAAGFPVLTFILPIGWKYKAVAMAYVPFLFVSCIMVEMRLYHEFIPLFFIGMESASRFSSNREAFKSLQPPLTTGTVTRG